MILNYYETAQAYPQIFKQLVCKNLLFVNYNCPLETSKQDSWSQHNYIIYIITGKKAIHTPTSSILLKKGQAAFVKKGACILEKFFDDVLCIVSFFIPDDYLCAFLSENSQLIAETRSPIADDELVIPLHVNDMMTAYYDSVMPYFDAEVKPPQDLLELKFRELLYNIISNPANGDLNSYLQTLLSPECDRLRSIVEANFRYNLKLEEYARLCNRSLSSFKRDFYNIYGTAPASWLLNKRLQLALQMLINSDKSIDDISFESGFENSTHFSRVFKKHYGSSPLRYRLQIRRLSTIRLDQ
jgi:AraC-like DNA-binding protein